MTACASARRFPTPDAPAAWATTSSTNGLAILRMSIGKALQVAQRRVPRSEVIDRESHAHRFQRLECRLDGFRMRSEHALGELQDQRVGHEARLNERGAHVGDELWALNLPAGDVDRHSQRIVRPAPLSPPLCLLAGFAQYPGAERAGSSRFLRRAR